MKIEIDLNYITESYLNDLAKEYKTTTSDIVSGLLIGYALSGLTEAYKTPKKARKRLFYFDLSRKKRFAKRYSGNFDYISLYGQKNYTNNESD